MGDAVNVITKAVKDTVNTATKGVGDAGQLVGDGLSGGFGLVEDGLSTVGKAVNDTVDTTIQAIDDTSSEIARISREGIFLDPNAAAKQSAKDDAKSDEAARLRAIEDQRQDNIDALKVRASNRSANKGSNIILGKGKKRKGSSVSSGLGLSKGDTGLQT